MQAKIHMQDQVKNRIELIMQDKLVTYTETETISLFEWGKRIIGDLATVGVVLIILTVGSGW